MTLAWNVQLVVLSIAMQKCHWEWQWIGNDHNFIYWDMHGCLNDVDLILNKCVAKVKMIKLMCKHLSIGGQSIRYAWFTNFATLFF